MEAAKWLADRGFGRPAPTLDAGTGEGKPMAIVLTWDDGGPA
jgi:hypothetical protein